MGGHAGRRLSAWVCLVAAAASRSPCRPLCSGLVLLRSERPRHPLPLQWFCWLASRAFPYAS